MEWTALWTGTAILPSSEPQWAWYQLLSVAAWLSYRSIHVPSHRLYIDFTVRRIRHLCGYKPEAKIFRLWGMVQGPRQSLTFHEHLSAPCTSFSLLHTTIFPSPRLPYPGNLRNTASGSRHQQNNTAKPCGVEARAGMRMARETGFYVWFCG